jgi:hypothetical protein
MIDDIDDSDDGDPTMQERVDSPDHEADQHARQPDDSADERGRHSRDEQADDEDETHIGRSGVTAERKGESFEEGDEDHHDPAEHERDHAHGIPAFQQFAHFDARADGGDVAGTPADDMAHWHHQSYLDSCAVACAEFVLDGLKDRDFQEKDLVREAIAHGWYKPGGGTPQLHVGSILEEHGVPVRHDYGSTLQDIVTRLDAGEKVIVGIQPQAMDGGAADETALAEYGGMPSQFAKHSVQVIGVKEVGGDDPLVIVNDPGRPDGAGLMIPAEVFERGWAPSGHFMVSTAVHDAEGAKDMEPPRFGGAYDRNGTYHRARA